MRQSRVIGIASVFLAAALSVPAWGADSADPGNAKANPARPGSLNYVQGQASIEGQSPGPEATGKSELNPVQSLAPGEGKAEVRLRRGGFLTLGDSSPVRWFSSGWPVPTR